MALTGRKQKFAAAKLAGFSNKDAAIKAGYSAATASQAGSRLVKDKDVIAYLKQGKKDVKKAPVKEESVPPPEYVSQGFDITQALMHGDPKAFLLAAMNDQELDPRQRIDAAKALLPFMHQKLGEGGKKDAAANKAKEAGAGKFSPTAPPRLAAAGGRKV